MVDALWCLVSHAQIPIHQSILTLLEHGFSAHVLKTAYGKRVFLIGHLCIKTIKSEGWMCLLNVTVVSFYNNKYEILRMGILT